MHSHSDDEKYQSTIGSSSVSRNTITKIQFFFFVSCERHVNSFETRAVSVLQDIYLRIVNRVITMYLLFVFRGRIRMQHPKVRRNVSRVWHTRKSEIRKISTVRSTYRVPP